MDTMRAEIAMLERALKNGPRGHLTASEALELCQRAASLMAPLPPMQRTMLVSTMLQMARLLQVREEHAGFALVMTLAKIIQTLEEDRPAQ
jgi:hypothetical protein